jgi:hypothetical protein
MNFGSENNCPNRRIPWFFRTLLHYYVYDLEVQDSFRPYCLNSSCLLILLHERAPLMHGFIVVVLSVLIKCLCVRTGEPGGADIGA